jgi:hypothetical protein
MISAASANAPNVKALVFVDAFAPEAGESIQDELASAPPPPLPQRLGEAFGLTLPRWAILMVALSPRETRMTTQDIAFALGFST